MVNVFKYFSDSTKITLPRSGRLTSTRDLFKWCNRASIDFNVSSQQSTLKVLQDGIDIFCCSYSSTEQSLLAARMICTHLGIVNEKADYFLKNHKPNLRLTENEFQIGRISIKREVSLFSKSIKFCFTRQAANLLERTVCCVNLNEPVLFVGETGTGKTSSVQYLANVIGQKLIVINMNQQSDSADLLGGFKPIDTKFAVAPVKNEFEAVFKQYFNVEQNKKYLQNINYCFNEQKWGFLLKLMKKSYDAAMQRLNYADNAVVSGKKKNAARLEKDQKFLTLWKEIGTKLRKLETQLKHKNSLAFAFVEGSLIKALQNGYWVLLDEINLANAETLECLSGLLEGKHGSLSLPEKGDKKPVNRHENFTLFACMNPSTDVGKKDLPAGLRNRFTEIYVDELTDKNDLSLLVGSYLDAMSLNEDKIESIVKFYMMIRKEAALSLSDDLGHKPHFSLRSLCRALTIASKNPCGMFNRSLYEAFCLSFLTQLDSKSYLIVENMIAR